VVRRALLAEVRARGRGVAEWVQPLLAAYRGADGQERSDCVAALEAVTGHAFGDDPERWEAWQAEHEAGLDAGRLEVADGAAERATAKPVPQAVTFYGIASPSRSVVFVLEGSENLLMPAEVAVQSTRHHFNWWTGKGGWRKDHVTHEALEKAEFAKALAALPDDATFGVVLPGTAVKTLPVQRATTSHRREAGRLLDGHAPGGWRSELDNLVAAMDLAGLRPLDVPHLPDPGADTVFLVCDGSILAGRYEAPAALLAAFGRLNRFRRLVVHVVHICNAGEYSEKFLQELAGMTGGTYRRVLKPPP
jgi:hypothetical protein